MTIENHKELVPFEHYRDIYHTLDPAEIAARCRLPFDLERSVFTVRLMGETATLGFPGFENTLTSKAEEILLLRYMCVGRYTPSQGARLSYPEVPWGNVYLRQFEGRCIRRLAGTFGADLDTFRRIVTERLHGEPLPQGDAGFRFEFLSGLYLSLLLWGPDEEFSAQAQFLFDDNLAAAFTAEDLAVVGDITINRLSRYRKEERL